ncbi:hypothetical protein PPL_10323 [Heterostelium album PN500]|uniref:Glycylpeptide N-tetradecanoyltransferase n=1 Tax=Heterostelium pallidum (strain ATCC 26659 / Pp 5 / PN500) TaxID=670386 RepID=D3BQ03_HETP5|nr:hypothetical protein PPL_10323 [Heterostelium album PN500]EFA76554.1 hypothetical protein PPL_10323 [Heterostelium album PN500]|eukprot:XP_020428686.1 hypothetical protein PPL_10323 [Heterostelium album PN500]
MNPNRSVSHKEAMSKLKFREYDELVDDQMLLSIPRIPPTVITHGLIAVSHPITFTVRPSLTPNHHIIITDGEEDRLVGVYAYTIREMRVLNGTRMAHYAFDCNVMPDQRNNGLSLLIIDYMLSQPMKKEGAIVYASSLKTRANVVIRKSGNLGARHYCDLYQHAWHCDFPVKLDHIPKDVEIKIWEEKDVDVIKAQWDAYYGPWSFTPIDFNEILRFNRKYYMTTYNAQLRRKGTNQQFKQGVRFLFIGLSELDPIKKHFPLFNSIQSLIFSFLILTKDEEDWDNLMKVKDIKPVYNDPRDYGVLMLHRDYTANKLSYVIQGGIFFFINSKLFMLAVQRAYASEHEKSKSGRSCATIAQSLVSRESIIESLPMFMILITNNYLSSNNIKEIERRIKKDLKNLYLSRNNLKGGRCTVVL